MDCSDASSARNGPSSPSSPSSRSTSPSPRRRYSMDEDLYYRHVMTDPPSRPPNPPPYRSCCGSPGTAYQHSRDCKCAIPDGEQLDGAYEHHEQDDSEPLPTYHSTVSIEGVFSKKHEIENTTKRAVDRHWHTVFVSLNGTALNVYTVKKDWGWGKTKDGPTISPDNPPWVKKAKLEKSYSLLHADAGIAADYAKRRYVIRIRAETDQFLLSCVELSTFVQWLECLFAAIDLAAPIDDREFPRDMSIPRVQRLRWFQGQSPALPGVVLTATDAQAHEGAVEELTSTTPPPPPPEPHALPAQPSRPPPRCSPLAHGEARSQSEPGEDWTGSMRRPPQRRLSITNYPNSSIDPHTGKWFPEHRWSSAHDLLYAKLCYSNLLFRSPRKSNYIISKGKQWFVDWKTGRMVRVMPPTYGEIDYFGPWQVIHTENVRI